MRSVEVLVIQPVSDDAMARIAAIDARFHWIDARYVFKDDYAETWFE
jgi:hypothetical protein